MPNRPILPATLARDSVEELKGFVSALLYARKLDTSKAILKCLFEDDPMIKGPFVQLSLPFVKAAASEWPLDPLLKQKFAPYSHQLKAYHRLAGDKPQHTLVTTGTGSGKSECFILPILDYVIRCKRQSKSSGVKALIIYPMNALIEDQGERLCELANSINRQLPSSQQIRIGRYTGSRGSTTAHDPTNPRQIIDDREALCKDPPDVLLTNYRMLDFMLFRPEEQAFWGDATRDVFRFLVLDELHTFDGAQGADVACLIRRLRLKILADFTCVGTSATVAGGNGANTSLIDQGMQALCEFATTLFGTKIPSDAVLKEDREEKSTFLMTDHSHRIPSENHSLSIDLLRQGAGEYAGYIEERCLRWQAPLDPVARAGWVKSHPLTAQLMSRELRGLPFAAMASKLGISETLLCEFLDLIASAREQVGDRLGPVLPMQVQLWVSETNSLMRRLAIEPEFRRLHDEHVPSGETTTRRDDFLPAINCRSCGLSGWLALKVDDLLRDDEYFLEWNYRKIKQAYHDQSAIILFPRTTEDQDREGRNQFYYDPRSEKLFRGDPAEDVRDAVLLNVAFLNYAVQKQMTHAYKAKKAKNDDLDRCPVCDSALSLSMSHVGSSMIGSVLAGAFLAHGANPDDKKTLIFNDSVQDAAHQAGYIGARGFRFNVRRDLYRTASAVREAKTGGTISYLELVTHLRTELDALWRAAMRKDAIAKQGLMQIVPKDLWELWKSKGKVNPLNQPGNLDQLVQRLGWEFWLELTLNADLGWSLRKTDLMTLKLKDQLFTKWVEIAKSIAMQCQYQLSNYESFVLGLAERLITRGVVTHEDLKASYELKKFNIWPLTARHEHLRCLFGPKFSRPNVLSLATSKEDGGQQYGLHLTSNSNRTWFERWAMKHKARPASSTNSGDGTSTQTKSPQIFLLNFMNALAHPDVGMIFAREGSESAIVMAQSATEIAFEKGAKFQCQSCDHIDRIFVSVPFNERPCSQYQCAGTMLQMTVAECENHEQFSGYLRKQYQRAIVAPLPHAHTGQMQADDRRFVEQAFKRGLLPGDSLNADGKGPPYYNDHPINVLTCTPTMEMGIDIGSLSGVILRGFPKSLANTLQRLGRSGRSSGNAFNAILSTKKPHDTYHWRHPERIFAGHVEPPGCHFRTKDVLKRQFHAYLLDSYATNLQGVDYPKEKELSDGDQFLAHPFWQGFKQYLAADGTVPRVAAFLEAVKLGEVRNSETPYQELQVQLLTTLGPTGLWSEIETVLKEQDFRRSQLKQAFELGASADKQASTPLGSESTNAYREDPEASGHHDGAEIHRQMDSILARQARTSTAEYTLKILADRGILPNYAFPDEGVHFSAAVSVPLGKAEGNGRRKFKNVKVSITRAAPNALVELAPGRSFYVEGFKIPVTRIVKQATVGTELLQKRLVCEACGTVSGADLESKSLSGQCPACGAVDQDIVSVISPKEIYGSGTFNDVQIRDGEENREKGGNHIETLINYVETDLQKGTSQFATWVSPNESLAFEFRTNAAINFLVRGAESSGKYQYFDVCSECWAVPYRKEDSVYLYKEIKFPQRPNTHAFSCPHYWAPNGANITTVKVALGKTIYSDAIRFFGNNKEFLPTLQSVLRLAMRLRLGGDASHLRVLASYLKSPEHGVKVVATLYDTVPGGTGHLSALMPMLNERLDSHTSGLEQLRSTFKETQRFLKDCSCREGCYDCLYSYDNQFFHETISKQAAIAWLGRFLRAGDWTREEAPLSSELANNTIFDSATEHEFMEGLIHRQPGIPGVTKVLAMQEGAGRAFSLQTANGSDNLVIAHTPDDLVYLKSGEIPYTKPDFTIWRNGKVVGYIYADGRDPHLSPAKELSTFEETDLPVRLALNVDLGCPDNQPAKVLTFSKEMITAWNSWLRKRSPHDKDLARPRAMQVLPTENSKYELHSLTCLLGSIFNPSFQFEIDRGQCFRDLFISYINLSVGYVCGTITERFLGENDLKKFQTVLSKVHDGATFGGLTFKKAGDGKPARFEMSGQAAVRIDSDGRISDDYRQSWELFWILWHIDRKLVVFTGQPLSAKAKSKVASQPHGYKDYLNAKQKLVVDWLIKHRSGVMHVYKDLPGLPEGVGAPFASTDGYYAFFDEQSLPISSGEMPASLPDGTAIFIVDLDTVSDKALNGLVPRAAKGAT